MNAYVCVIPKAKQHKEALRSAALFAAKHDLTRHSAGNNLELKKNCTGYEVFSRRVEKKNIGSLGFRKIERLIRLGRVVVQ